MTTKVIPMKPKKPASPKVKPPDTWAVHSPVGVLKNIKGDGLERLEAIHAFLMERDRLLTSEDAAVRVFGPFIADANSALGMKHGAAKLRPLLHIVAPHRAVPIGELAGRKHLDDLAELVPYVHHTHFERGTPEALLYALGVMAGEVWAPHGGDVDLNDRLGDDCPDGYFPPVAKCRELLGPLAVPFALAHSLWGWGTVEKALFDETAKPVDKDAELLNLLSAYEVRGKKTRAQFAKDKNLTEPNLKKLLGVAVKLRNARAETTPNSVFGWVTKGSQKVAKK